MMQRGKYFVKAVQAMIGVALLIACLRDMKLHTHLDQRSPNLRVYNTSDQQPGHEANQCLVTNTKRQFYICPHVTSEDIYISRSLSTQGVWEPKITEILQDILENASGKTTFIDIGANIGYFSLLAAAYGHKVIAVEPVVKNLKHFKTAIVINGFTANVLVLRNVVSDVRNDAMVLALSRNNQGAARVLSAGELRNKGTVVEPAVSILMDDLIGLVHTPDVIIKLDVEGHECKAMAKSTQLFRLFNVKAVFMEWQKMSQRKHIYGSACQPGEIFELAKQLSTWGFTPYDVLGGNRHDFKDSASWTSGDVVWLKAL